MTKIVQYSGDILDYADKVDVIGHQVNCFGVMGGGLAYQIAEKYPDVLTAYQKYINDFLVFNKKREGLLGSCQIVPSLSKCYIANLFGQFDMGGGRRTDYEALLLALKKLKKQMSDKGLKKLALPVKLGCGLAGGDWKIVQSLIHEAFEGSDIEITLVEYKVD